ncbi:MAG: folate-binding protein YgfZ [Reyranellaceae bacterium]
MTEAYFFVADDRGVLAVGGPDRRSFLQGLISNDVEKISPHRAIHAALLTPQGRYLHDFFIVESGETLLIDAERARLPELQKKLSMFRLRSKVTLEDQSARWAVAAIWGPAARETLKLPAEAGSAAPFAEGVAYVDPRLAAMGCRAVLPADQAAASLARAGLEPADQPAWDIHRLALGVPDGSRDLPVEKAFLLESGFDELNGVDWKKGCYMGQELTARTKYRGLVRKRLLPVTVEGPMPAPGTPVMLGGKEAGEMRSGRDGHALALLRLEHVAAARENGPLTAGAATLTAHVPAWVRLPETAEG